MVSRVSRKKLVLSTLDESGLDKSEMDNSRLDNSGLEDSGLENSYLDDSGSDDSGPDDCDVDDDGLRIFHSFVYDIVSKRIPRITSKNYSSDFRLKYVGVLITTVLCYQNIDVNGSKEKESIFRRMGLIKGEHEAVDALPFTLKHGSFQKNFIPKFDEKSGCNDLHNSAKQSFVDNNYSISLGIDVISIDSAYSPFSRGSLLLICSLRVTVLQLQSKSQLEQPPDASAGGIPQLLP
ncbi:unnamed protein product [Bemisia tabaci]|uniref:Uncharacterized protein n=1 Tax=Bemisia tabaci TaxID=7038 RepID=A0A9P0AKH9_BEMTA|nr:unnamed protein product [Bemisia tabaci]